MKFTDRQQALLDALEARIVVLDGAMGTMIQRRHLTAADFGGAATEGCNEYLCLTRPEAILEIHRAFLAAGADVVETNSFGGTALVLAEYGLAGQAREINRAAARLARQAAEEYSRPGRPRLVAGAMGPTTKAITVTGGVTFPELERQFHEQAAALVEGGADLLLVETCQDTRNTKAALRAIRSLERELGRSIPVMVSGTIEPMGTMLAGQPADAFWVSVAHAGLLSIGLNCATGPEFMTDHLRTLDELAWTRISCHPNAGLPDEEGRYLETPESLAAQLERCADHGWLNMVGGCCGTTPAHLRLIAQMAEGKRPRRTPGRGGRSFYSGIDLVEAEDSSRPLLVGERTNVIGSRIFRNLIAAEKWEEASEVARRQVRNGAHIVDVCLQSSERDEGNDIPPFYEKLIHKVKAPGMWRSRPLRGSVPGICRLACKPAIGSAIDSTGSCGNPLLVRRAVLGRPEHPRVRARRAATWCIVGPERSVAPIGAQPQKQGNGAVSVGAGDRLQEGIEMLLNIGGKSLPKLPSLDLRQPFRTPKLNNNRDRHQSPRRAKTSCRKIRLFHDKGTPERRDARDRDRAVAVEDDFAVGQSGEVRELVPAGEQVDPLIGRAEQTAAHVLGRYIRTRDENVDIRQDLRPPRQRADALQRVAGKGQDAERRGAQAAQQAL
jgi:methionine synthase I (cobalamin-dependent)